MKNLVVAGMVLLIVYVGPQRDQADPAHVLWAMGLLIITSYVLQQLARGLRLPDMVAWLTAGVVLGATGLRLVLPAELPQLALLGTLSGVWVGFQTGACFSIPAGFGWRGPALLAAITLATAALATVGIALVVEPPWWLAVLLGTLACLWGPFTFVPTQARRNALLLGAIGAGIALVLLSAVLGVLQLQGLVSATARIWVLRLWGSLIAGVLGAGLLQRLGLLSVRLSTLTAGLLGTFLVTALFIQHLALFALPCGFGAGLAVARQRVPVHRLRFLLRSASPVAFMLFFALLGATLDLRELWPIRPDVGRIVLVQVAVVVAVRGLGAVLLYPLPASDAHTRRRLGWLLLPSGALLFELVFHPQHSLQSLLGPEAAQLLAQVVAADVLVYLLLFSTLSRAVQHWHPPVSESPGIPAPVEVLANA